MRALMFGFLALVVVTTTGMAGEPFAWLDTPDDPSLPGQQPVAVIGFATCCEGPPQNPVGCWKISVRKQGGEWSDAYTACNPNASDYGWRFISVFEEGVYDIVSPGCTIHLNPREEYPICEYTDFYIDSSLNGSNFKCVICKCPSPKCGCGRPVEPAPEPQ
jgi:hypothetical protein